MSGKAKAYVLEFTLQGLPRSPNTLLGAHWSVRSGHAKKWKRLVWAKCWHKRPPQPLELALITLTRVSSGTMDDDNLTGSFKSVRDGLKDAGIIVDDSPKHVRVNCLAEKCAPKAGFVRVRVEQLPKELE